MSWVRGYGRRPRYLDLDEDAVDLLDILDGQGNLVAQLVWDDVLTYLRGGQSVIGAILADAERKALH